MPEPPKILKLDEIEAVAGPGTLSWLPVRYTLGIRAFGCNAYRAAEAGQDVVEPHTEDPKLAHEELYFVARGSATFTIDGQRYDADAGTYVFIPDPGSHRHAVANEPGTTILSFGGPPSFEPSPWEWAFRAAAIQRSDPAQARAILQEGLRHHPEGATLHYGLACVEVVEGKHEQALDSLAKAIALRPDARAWAQEDGDLDALREDPGFRSLVDS